MMPPLRPLVLPIMLALAASAQAAPALSLMDQADGLPADFREHFFGAPLVIRVERDGQYLGDATMVLSPDNTIQLVAFADTHDSTLGDEERARWARALAAPRPLGSCAERCTDGLLALHYSLENSVLSLVTSQAERTTTSPRYYTLPDGGSRGLILRNNVIAFAGQGQAGASSYALDAVGSWGSWSITGSYQAYRGADESATLQQTVQSLYAQREYRDTFVRAGYFIPDFQGVTRQPNTPDRPAQTTVGLMIGSSDILAINEGQASLVPLYVTANRQGTVEVYRNGALIHTQPVDPGLQWVDTRRLPGGIYDVEVRVVEDGQVASRQTERISKPTQWQNLDKRVRYSAFLGQQHDLLGGGQRDTRDGELAAGAIINYLAHPRAVLGVSAQQIGRDRAIGSSLNWQVRERSSVYANLYHSTLHGTGLDLQAITSHRTGSIMLNHGRRWQTLDRHLGTRGGWVDSTAVSVNQRFGPGTTFTGRISHARGATDGIGVDLSLHRSQTLFGNNATWRASVFDRPMGYTHSGQARRNRGVEISVNLAMGNDTRRYQASAGSRTDARGSREFYGTVGVQQQLAAGPVRTLSATATGDRHGLGLSADAQFDSKALAGNAFAQTSTLDGAVSGGVNLRNTIAIGGGRVAAAGHTDADTGMILDLDVDPGLNDVTLQASDSHGASFTLRPGRNFIPVSAYRSGRMQIDFAGRDAPAASIFPASVGYHALKGGVQHGAVSVSRTVTVIGRVVDAQGQPLRGAQVHNHVGRSVAEADGFFTLEMSANKPEVEIRHPGIEQCRFTLDPARYPREGDVVMAGRLACPVTAVQLSRAD